MLVIKVEFLLKMCSEHLFTNNKKITSDFIGFVSFQCIKVFLYTFMHIEHFF